VTFLSLEKQGKVQKFHRKEESSMSPSPETLSLSATCNKLTDHRGKEVEKEKEKTWMSRRSRDIEHDCRMQQKPGRNHRKGREEYKYPVSNFFKTAKSSGWSSTTHPDLLVLDS
jgi:hypothetical protein